ncbi:uncharacterized protein J7T54_006541 [Emericellopsis cladophorae]|uniref:NDT80 domain-containing protein n=1 Tax=Emericellopsis cladophorae TaxID=2686198 RepID=A0A9P9Y6P8_9HYPO|nr:uncharacterized protein J7T54_006541 [Emericellopsis cladophorae]KAI6784496.1 hypothetical protein J7T54_006541 [Emericellopsis cladophorae]
MMTHQPDLNGMHFEDAIFEDALLDSGALPHIPFTPSYEFDSFATTFEDPFQYSAAKAFEPPPNPANVNDEASPQELDNKLLGFSEPTVSATVLDEVGNIGETSMSAELYGMFFVAEDVFGAEKESKVAGPPPSLPLDLAAGQELDANRVSLPVSWKRLQFKHATANNGRRKGLQQHYVVQISLLGNTKAGDTITIAEIRSGPVIVRGRSPRNFDSRKDVPLTGDKRLERRNTAGSADQMVKTERDAFQTSLHKPQSMGAVPSNEWVMPQPFTQPSQGSHPAKRMAISPTVAKPPVPGWSRDSASAFKQGPNAAQAMKAKRNSTSAPINLSLSDDERSPNRSSAELPSPHAGKIQAVPGLAPGSSPPEEEDPLYEYFPLSVDDWMPPVDAVYRPHVVHHTIVPPEIKAQQMQSKTKRYFVVE